MSIDAQDRATVEGKLFLVSYEAPAIYAFEKDLAAFHQMVDTFKF